MSKKILAAIILVIIITAALSGVYIYSQRNTVSDTAVPEEMAVEISPTPDSIPSPTATSSAQQPVANSMLEVIVSDSASGASATSQDNKTAFSVSAPELFITVKLANDTTATQAGMLITYNADDSRLGPVASPIKKQNGQTFSAFKVTKPTNGWPDGPYTLDIALSTGENKQLTLIFK